MSRLMRSRKERRRNIYKFESLEMFSHYLAFGVLLRERETLKAENVLESPVSYLFFLILSLLCDFGLELWHRGKKFTTSRKSLFFLRKSKRVDKTARNLKITLLLLLHLLSQTSTDSPFRYGSCVGNRDWDTDKDGTKFLTWRGEESWGRE